MPVVSLHAGSCGLRGDCAEPEQPSARGRKRKGPTACTGVAPPRPAHAGAITDVSLAEVPCSVAGLAAESVASRRPEWSRSRT